MTYQVIGTTRTRAFRVLWLLEEMGLPYDHIAAGPRSAQALAVNPSGKVPVLVVDGVALTDSTAILTYLCDRHGQFTTPAGTVDRARQDGMTGLILDEIEALLWAAARHSFILPEAMRLPALNPVLQWEYGQNLSRLAAGWRGPFVMGDQMTLPDIVLTHCLVWAELAGFPGPDQVLGAYLARMRERPAWARVAKGRDSR